MVRPIQGCGRLGRPCYLFRPHAPHPPGSGFCARFPPRVRSRRAFLGPGGSRRGARRRGDRCCGRRAVLVPAVVASAAVEPSSNRPRGVRCAFGIRVAAGAIGRPSDLVPDRGGEGPRQGRLHRSAQHAASAVRSSERRLRRRPSIRSSPTRISWAMCGSKRRRAPPSCSSARRRCSRWGRRTSSRAGRRTSAYWRHQATARLSDAVSSERKRSAIATTVFSVSLLVFSALIAFWLLGRASDLAGRLRTWMADNPERVAGDSARQDRDRERRSSAWRLVDRADARLSAHADRDRVRVADLRAFALRVDARIHREAHGLDAHAALLRFAARIGSSLPVISLLGHRGRSRSACSSGSSASSSTALGAEIRRSPGSRATSPDRRARSSALPSSSSRSSSLRRSSRVKATASCPAWVWSCSLPSVSRRRRCLLRPLSAAVVDLRPAPEEGRARRIRWSRRPRRRGSPSRRSPRGRRCVRRECSASSRALSSDAGASASAARVARRRRRRLGTAGRGREGVSSRRRAASAPAVASSSCISMPPARTGEFTARRIAETMTLGARSKTRSRSWAWASAASRSARRRSRRRRPRRRESGS